jgi:CRISPR-associated endoribonuclease Cas6
VFHDTFGRERFVLCVKNLMPVLPTKMVKSKKLAFLRGLFMRLQLSFVSPKPIHLPIHYGHSVQGLIYSQLEPNLAKWLHGEAYTFAERTYKMFTFSRLEGAYTLDKPNKRITFTDTVSFQLASHNSEMLASFAEHLLKAQDLRLGQNHCQVRGVEILKQPEVDFSKPIKVRTLSPITIYSTLTKPDGKKLTHYYNPFEKDWSEMIRENLVRKVKSLEWEDDAAKVLADLQFKPLRVSAKDEKIIHYKGSFVKAWTGVYEVSNMLESYFYLAYDVGLGAKNSQGMGMVEVMK